MYATTFSVLARPTSLHRAPVARLYYFQFSYRFYAFGTSNFAIVTYHQIKHDGNLTTAVATGGSDAREADRGPALYRHTHSTRKQLPSGDIRFEYNHLLQHHDSVAKLIRFVIIITTFIISVAIAKH